MAASGVRLPSDKFSSAPRLAPTEQLLFSEHSILLREKFHGPTYIEFFLPYSDFPTGQGPSAQDAGRLTGLSDLADFRITRHHR